PVCCCEGWDDPSIPNFSQHYKNKNYTSRQARDFILDSVNDLVNEELRGLAKLLFERMGQCADYNPSIVKELNEKFEVKIAEYLKRLAEEEGYAEREDDLWYWFTQNKDNAAAVKEFERFLGKYIKTSGEREDKAKEIEKEILHILKYPVLELLVNNLIKAQARGDDIGGVEIDFWWARAFKQEIREKAVYFKEGYSIYSFAKEYQLERENLDAVKKSLKEADWLIAEYEKSLRDSLKQVLVETGVPEEESVRLAEELSGKHGTAPESLISNLRLVLKKKAGKGEEEAQRLTERLAELLMTGGLGSFKPDLNRAWFEVFKKILGEEWARENFTVFAIFYSTFIKRDGGKKDRIELEVVKVARALFGDPVKEYEIDLGEKAMKKFSREDEDGRKLNNRIVTLRIYKDRFSPVSQYWLYCPEIFDQIYPADRNSDWRALQTLVYREACLRFITEKEEANFKNTGAYNKLIFALSEVNTTLLIPWVVDDAHKKYTLFSPQNVLLNHYTHTPVPDGLHFYEEDMFDVLNISKEYRGCLFYDGKFQRKIVDLVKLTGEALKVNNTRANFINACSIEHALKTQKDIFRDYAHLVKDTINAEGALAERWMGDSVRAVVD
ncbi:MAG: hypothetical protein WA066_01760, partial [Candidatus Omnitrophota bacterium]